MIIFIVQRALNGCDLIIESSELDCTDLWSFVNWIRWFWSQSDCSFINFFFSEYRLQFQIKNHILLYFNGTFFGHFVVWQLQSLFTFIILKSVSRIFLKNFCVSPKKEVWIDQRVNKWWHFRFWVNYSFN